MSTDPWVTIVTPTFPGRERVLLERCIPSVQAQTPDPYGIQHLIVSDRNGSLFRQISPLRLTSLVDLEIIEINEAWRNGTLDAGNGSFPWMMGSFLAMGEYIGFLGDDDELLPHHVETHVKAMQEAGALWSLSKVEFRAGGHFWNVIGDDSYVEGHLDATGIMCHKDALKTATWQPNGHMAGDWQLVDAWRRAGLPGVFIDQVTGIHHDGWLSGLTGKPYDPPLSAAGESG